MGTEIPDKLYFKIGEVAQLAGVKPHVLRYWESEFPSIRPAKSKTKQRLYRRSDIELILQLKDLLYERGFTIAGAKKLLASKSQGRDGAPSLPDSERERQLLVEVKQELLALRKSLESLP